MKELKEMELLRKISSKFICIGSNPLKNAEVFYIGGSDTLPPPLKKDEEEALMKKLANGDMSVKATLIERNLRLVVYIARKFENTGIYVEDLISIGTIGLIKAINTFNPLKNIKLATYASRCIENEILMYLRKTKRKKRVSKKLLRKRYRMSRRKSLQKVREVRQLRRQRFRKAAIKTELIREAVQDLEELSRYRLLLQMARSQR